MTLWRRKGYEMDRTVIETFRGTMTAFPWHHGKHVAADPSGFNWRIDGDEVDKVIHVLETPGTSFEKRYENETLTITSEKDKVVIEASGMRFVGRLTTLTPTGRDQFLEILRSVLGRPSLDELIEQHHATPEYQQWKRERDAYFKTRQH